MQKIDAASDNAGNADATGTSRDLRAIKKKLPLRVLTPEQFKRWQSYGYIVVPSVVPLVNVVALKSFLWEFQEMDENDPSTWQKPQLLQYELAALNGSGMVEAYHHQTLWDNRQVEKVYDIFVDIWDQEELWVTIDRANLNPPNIDKSKFDGFLHWDIDTVKRPLTHNVQAIVTLVDTTPDMGGFQCVPELFHQFDKWAKTQPDDRDPYHPDRGSFELIHPQLKAGDMLIFNSLMAHGIKVNNSDQARMAQYISMFPAQENNVKLRDERLRLFAEKTAPMGKAFSGDPRYWERERYPAAQLNALGEKLLGSRSWK